MRNVVGASINTNINHNSTKEQCPLYEDSLEELGWTEKGWYDQMIFEYITKYPHKTHKEYYQWFKCTGYYKETYL